VAMAVEWAPRAQDELKDLPPEMACEVVRASLDCVYPPRPSSPYEGTIPNEDRAWRRAMTTAQMDEFEAAGQESTASGPWDYVLVYRRVGGRLFFSEDQIRIEQIISNRELVERWEPPT
jgi:hypothetical protein